tara:strand:+ start:351 stop:464 length:114 start_codon:yes stop_codon:yes gene_type:complete
MNDQNWNDLLVFGAGIIGLVIFALIMVYTVFHIAGIL